MMRPVPGRAPLPWLALAALLAAAPVHAQAAHGRVVEAGTGQAVSGAVVELVDAGGARVAATISDAQGAYALRAAAPGTYTVRAQRVGFAAAASPALQLAAGQDAEQPLRMQPRQVSLEPLLVTAAQRECTIRPQAEAAVVWEELRKVLDAASVGDQSRHHTYRKRIFTQDRTLRSRRTYNRQEWTLAFSDEAFHATPVDRLAQHGFVENVQGDSVVFYVPDANTLLSDAFLDHHCFRLRERRGSVGLEFAPTADRTLPDIRGVLWMDRRTAQLRRLEYTYVNLPYPNPDDALGGEMVFEQLPDGGWMVRRWAVRMPRFRVSERGTPFVAGLVEQGGAIVSVRPAP
jgi:hypothetical protein